MQPCPSFCADTDDPRDEEANIPLQRFADTFESCRQSLLSTYTDEDEEFSWKYEKYQYTDYDFECLKSVLRPMQELLRHEPEKRISAEEAAALIEWTDHRRIDSKHMDEQKEEPDQESQGNDD